MPLRASIEDKLNNLSDEQADLLVAMIQSLDQHGGMTPEAATDWAASLGLSQTSLALDGQQDKMNEILQDLGDVKGTAETEINSVKAQLAQIRSKVSAGELSAVEAKEKADKLVREAQAQVGALVTEIAAAAQRYAQ